MTNAVAFLFYLFLGLELLTPAFGAAASKPLTKRIYDGAVVPNGNAPYAASLKIVNKNGNKQLCGATIISPDYLITAAHCLTPYDSSTQITIGYDSQEINSQKTAKAEKVFVHPKYLVNNVAYAQYDLAIIKVQGLHGKATKRILIYTGSIETKQKLFATGWGQAESSSVDTTKLRNATLYVGDDNTCRSYMSDFDTNNGALICTPTDQSSGAGVCTSDAGAPVVTGKGSDFMFVGIASRIASFDGKFCGGTKAADFFVHISYHMDFITKTTGLTKQYLSSESDFTEKLDDDNDGPDPLSFLDNGGPLPTGVRLIYPTNPNSESSIPTSTVYSLVTLSQYIAML